MSMMLYTVHFILKAGEEANIPGKLVENEGVEKPTLDEIRPVHHRLPDSFANPGTGVPPVPSSLRVPHTPSWTVFHSEPLPNQISSMDEKACAGSIFPLPRHLTLITRIDPLL